jgi:3-deoxy-D-manno-octulosonic acid kinase
MLWRRLNQHHIWQHPDIDFKIENQWFNPDYWHLQNQVQATRFGRKVSHIIEYQNQKWFLRHYYRGGQIRHFNEDKYWFSGLKNCRSYVEFTLLKQLDLWQLPVPKPIAAHAILQGCFYRANIILQALHEHHDLAHWLQQQYLPHATWLAIGRTIAAFHARGVDHQDLNLKNILWNGQTVYLVDFDKCLIKLPSKRWQETNLARLYRSLDKFQHSIKSKIWLPDAWAALLQGYQLEFS